MEVKPTISEPTSKHRPVDIVVTGTGLITSLGLDRVATWSAICAGQSGIGALSALEQQPAEPRGGGQAPELPRDEASGEPREVRYLRRAIAEALRGAGCEDGLPCPADRCGIVMGTTLHGMRAAGQTFRDGDFEHLRRFQSAAVIERALDGLPISGAGLTTCAACSSGLSSVGLAMTLLETGELDLVIAGGYDTISEYAYGGFNALRLVAEGPIRPFGEGREGMKLGEGYGVLIVERAADAAKRGRATGFPLLGLGETADAHHLTQPHPEGDGAARAIDKALTQAQLNPCDIDLISAHATGTPNNDRGESAAFHRVFGERLSEKTLVAFKSQLGHTLGGAGAVELILCMCALLDQKLPPTANVDPDTLEYPDLRFVTGEARPAEVRHTVNVSVGFGGANTAVVVGRPRALRHDRVEARPRVDAQRDVCVTGVGVVMPGAIGNDAFAAQLADASRPMITRAPGPIDPASIVDLLQTSRVRRMSDYVKLSLASTQLAVRDAGLDGDPGFAKTCAAVLGSTHGSAAYSETYYAQIVREGIDLANPMLFAEGVPNAGAAHLSLMLGLKGPCQTIIGSRTGGLDALRIAALRIASGHWDRAIVSTAEESTDLIERAYRHCGLHAPNGEAGGPPLHPARGFVMGQGAATLVLESRAAAEARGARVRAVIERAASAILPMSDPRAATARAAGMLGALGPVERIVSGADSTALGRLEADALAATDGDRPVTVSSLYGHAAETFSVMPIAAIAAVLLTGRLPRLHGDVPPKHAHLLAATGDETPTRFAVLAVDPFGPLAGATVRTGD